MPEYWFSCVAQGGMRPGQEEGRDQCRQMILYYRHIHESPAKWDQTSGRDFDLAPKRPLRRSRRDHLVKFGLSPPTPLPSGGFVKLEVWSGQA
ncbi:hypothetical protein KEM48_013964 [Puccinia striiformis f. sp. tritici PST-130]|nr:hypothetical protein KEM48_013964 [Puccinia striiformis f. sp. tritici PST-130]